MSDSTKQQEVSKPRMSGGKIFLIAFLGCLLALLVFGFIAWRWVFHSSIEPVSLSPSETVVLDDKLRVLGLETSQNIGTAGSSTNDTISAEAASPHDTGGYSDDIQDGVLQPEKYSEEGASREIQFSEREINALLANNTDLADKVAIDLSEGMISAKIVLPVEEGTPLFGGRTVRANAGISAGFAGGKPSLIVKGVSVYGVPVPAPWLADLKGKDLIKEYGESDGFWGQFAKGIEYLEVKNGELIVKLAP